MSLLVAKNLSKRFPGTPRPAVDRVSLAVEEGEVMVVVGESGSGKTTFLRLIAGLEIPDAGEVTIRGKVVADDKTNLPPERRGVAMVFQDYALFPHLTVEGNVAYGLRRKNKDQRALVDFALELVDLRDFARRYPHELSGGQQQRVALARAMAPKPALVLLDEPFSNLDATLKQQVRDELRDIFARAGTTALFVTHDTRDAMCVGDRIAVLRDGSLQQVGTPEMIYRCPFNEYTARFFGKANRVPAEVLGRAASDRPLWVRPEDFDVVEGERPGAFAGRLRKLTFLGECKELVVACGEASVELTVYVDSDFRAAPGARVWLRPKNRHLPDLSPA